MSTSGYSTLRVATLNFWGIPYISKHRLFRLNALISELRRDEYDIVALQEVWSVADFERLSSECRDVLPYSHYFHSGVIGSGLCVLSRHPIMKTFFKPYTINGKVYKVTQGDFLGGKGVGTCQIAFTGGVAIDLFVTHLHANYGVTAFDSNSYQAHRVSQAWELAEFICLMRRTGAVQVLCGDLNTESKELGLTLLQQSIPLDDSVNVAGEDVDTCDRPDNLYTPKSGKRPKRIDYILYGGSVRMACNECSLAFRTIPDSDIPYSDHEGVEATFSIQPTTLYSTADEWQVTLTSLTEATTIVESGIKDAETRGSQHKTMAAVFALLWLYSIFCFDDTIILSGSFGAILTTIIFCFSFCQFIFAFAFIPCEIAALRQTASSLRQTTVARKKI